MVLLLGKIWYDRILVAQKTYIFYSYVHLFMLHEPRNHQTTTVSVEQKTLSKNYHRCSNPTKSTPKKKPKEACMVDPMISRIG